MSHEAGLYEYAAIGVFVPTLTTLTLGNVTCRQAATTIVSHCEMATLAHDEAQYATVPELAQREAATH